jgi:LytR cell envelope-related transcriptional attenuator
MSNQKLSARRLSVLVAGVAIAAAAGCTSRSLSSPTTTTAAPTTITPTTPAPTVAPTTTAAPTTTTIPPTTTTTLPLITEGAVVMVANASGVTGAAARLSDQLAAVKFVLVEPTNAAGIDESLEVSKIYVKAGGEAVANQLAELMGAVAVLPMPTPAWITNGTAGLGDATVLIMLGKDLADKDLPGLADR